MEKKIRIMLNDGSEVFLADLTQADLPRVKLEAKEGKSWLAMKSEVVAESDTHWTEKRLYKWNIMPSLVMYEARYPKTVSGLVKDWGEDSTWSHAVRDWIIAQDKDHNGVQGTGKGKLDATDKAILAVTRDQSADVKAIMLELTTAYATAAEPKVINAIVARLKQAQGK